MQKREKENSSEAEDIIRNGNCKIVVPRDRVKSIIVIQVKIGYIKLNLFLISSATCLNESNIHYTGCLTKQEQDDLKVFFDLLIYLLYLAVSLLKHVWFFKQQQKNSLHFQNVVCLFCGVNITWDMKNFNQLFIFLFWTIFFVSLVTSKAQKGRQHVGYQG